MAALTFKIFLAACALLYAAFAAFAYYMSDRMTFLPPPPSYRPGELPIVHVEASEGAAIATLYLRNPDATFTLLYSHGNAEDLGQIAGVLNELRLAGFSVLAYDYRGYGLSTGGPPTADGAYLDAAAVHRYAVRDLGISPSRIILHGRSVGSGPAVELATRVPVGGLVIESGFVSVFRLVTGVPLLPFDKFPNLRRLREVDCPVLVVHGTDDEVIPFSHGERLFNTVPGRKQALWVEGGHHNDLVRVAGESYPEALRDFAGTIAERSAAPN